VIWVSDLLCHGEVHFERFPFKSPISTSGRMASERVPPHVWMAPDMQEFFYVKRRSRLRSCVRPFCAVALGPLALMDSAGRGLISWSGFESR